MTFVELLAARARDAEFVVDAQLDRALAQLDRTLAQLAAELRVEYFGPHVGVGAGRAVYRLVVREHRFRYDELAWSLKVCTALPHAQWRADWAIQGVSRARKILIVRALPAFFAGYASALTQAGCHESGAARRVRALAAIFDVAHSA